MRPESSRELPSSMMSGQIANSNTPTHTPPTLRDVVSLAFRFNEQSNYALLTRAFIGDRYNPRPWLDRAQYFLGKYNELACADALKAYMLCGNSMLPTFYPDAEHLHWQVRLQYSKTASWIIFQALRELGAYSAANEWLGRFPRTWLHSMHLRRGVDKTKWKQQEQPKLARHIYPWALSSSHGGPLTKVDKFMKERGLRVDRASFANDDKVKGVFATRPFQTGSTIMLDRLIAQAVLPFGCTEGNRVSVLLKHVIKGLSELVSEEGGSVDVVRPDGLDTLAATHGVPPDDFNFERQIRSIALVLLRNKKLFSADFDFWKIFSLYWKLCTNACTGDRPPTEKERKKNAYSGKNMDNDGNVKIPLVGIAQHYSFFNHSCRADAEWGTIQNAAVDRDHPTVMEVTALRDIQAGEEIFISYLGLEDLELPLSERRAVLRDWFETDCQCTRCQEQEQELTATASAGTSGAAVLPAGPSRRAAAGSSRNVITSPRVDKRRRHRDEDEDGGQDEDEGDKENRRPAVKRPRKLEPRKYAS